jgi:hypothetical protein
LHILVAAISKTTLEAFLPKTSADLKVACISEGFYQSANFILLIHPFKEALLCGYTMHMLPLFLSLSNEFS